MKVIFLDSITQYILFTILIPGIFLIILMPNISAQGSDSCDSIPPWGIVRLELDNSIILSDLNKARESFQLLTDYRAQSAYCIGEQHVEFFAPRKKMDSLKKNLDEGDFVSAQKNLFYLSSSCGNQICHRKKDSMIDLELSYFDIADSIASGDLSRARKSFGDFEKAYFITKDEFERIMPSMSSQMDKKYVENLQEALYNNDLSASKRAFGNMYTGVCSSEGCHGFVYIDKSGAFQEVEGKIPPEINSSIEWPKIPGSEEPNEKGVLAFLWTIIVSIGHKIL